MIQPLIIQCPPSYTIMLREEADAFGENMIQSKSKIFLKDDIPTWAAYCQAGNFGRDGSPNHLTALYAAYGRATLWAAHTIGTEELLKAMSLRDIVDLAIRVHQKKVSVGS